MSTECIIIYTETRIFNLRFGVFAAMFHNQMDFVYSHGIQCFYGDKTVKVYLLGLQMNFAKIINLELYLHLLVEFAPRQHHQNWVGADSLCEAGAATVHTSQRPQ